MAHPHLGLDAPGAPPREWWQIWAERRARWWEQRPTLTRRWARARAIGLWLALAWLGVVVLVVPDVTLGMRAYLGCVWLVIAWFALARTKTLTWSGLMRFFAACVPWAVLIGVLSAAMARTAGDDGSMFSEGIGVLAVGSQVAIAALTEEALKLAPVVVVAMLAPRRAARFAAIDWVLLGIASGSAFLAAEETLRRVSWQTGAGRGLLDWGPADEVPDGWVTFGLFPLPSSWANGDAGFGGHAIITPIITGLVGLGIAWWRTTRNPALRTVTVALPALALWSAIADHAGYNIQGMSGAYMSTGGLLSGETTAAWLEPDVTTVPWWLRVPWSLLGHGHGRPAIFLVVVVLCLLVDARRLAAHPGTGLVPGRQAPAWVPRTEGAVARMTGSWPRPLAVATRTAWGAVAALTWTTLRDAGDVLVAGARQPGERRRLAAQRVAAAVSGQRTARELVLEEINGPVRARLRRTIAGVALVVLAWLAFWVAPETAGAIGRSASDLLGWLAGVADSLIDWWDEQSPLTQIVIGAGIAALVVLSGGSLGLAMGVSGVLTWGLDKGHGIQTFVRDPGQATRDYVTTATPGTILADTLGFALTFAPTNFVGAGLGRGLRDAALDIADDPAAWAAARRASMRDDRGAVRPASFLGTAPDETLEAATRELRGGRSANACVACGGGSRTVLTTPPRPRGTARPPRRTTFPSTCVLSSTAERSTMRSTRSSMPTK